MFRRRSSGNWAEELGQTMHSMMVWGLVCFVLVPILLLGWFILLFLLIFR